jgi:TonB family protein
MTIALSLLLIVLATPLSRQARDDQAVRPVCPGVTDPSGFCPARRLSGPMPPPSPPNAVGWIDQTFELTVDAAGLVAGTNLLEGTSADANLVVPAVSRWLFRPATDEGRAVASRVLVVAMYRPPVTYNGPVAGSPPVAIAAPSREIPLPATVTRPMYPLQGIAEGVVLVEVLVGPDGRVRAAAVIDGVDGLNQAALAAARDWSFHPAGRNGQPAAAFAYLIFGFRRPV